MHNSVNYQVYCQACGADLTDKGGEVPLASKKVYCPPDEGMMYGCVFKAALERREITTVVERHDRRKLQELIAQKKIINYGPLERSLHS